MNENLKNKTIAQFLNVKEFPFEINDSQGKVIYYESSDGYWAKSEYDSKGNEIYYEDSNGFWIKSEYDSHGNKITMKILVGKLEIIAQKLN